MPILDMLGAVCAAEPDLKRPNILLILADDMGWSDVGCYGSEIATPNLDSLARGGLRFTQFYNTAKCNPSRACLLTGVYAQQCRMMNPAKIQNAVTLGEVLRTAGYRTLWSGKHHGTENPFTRGFDHYFGLRDGACNYFNPGFQRPGEGRPAQKRYGGRSWCIDDQTLQPYTPVEKDFYTTDYFTKYGLKWLDELQQSDPAGHTPFFLYMAYHAPHDPLMAWPEDIAKYQQVPGRL
ncbi:MAG: sulfatase-like hydrolase/transferase [Akkermansiaceae bacterium]|nr:sulfatase-like hydrolase/transferase [Akkermansiaceae bacterium]MCF7731208.1 sulfatase-like hydrolase/transferase [Akkermansiaceae bacterium]